LKLREDSPPLLAGDADDVDQLAIVFLDEHQPQECCGNCSLKELRKLRQGRPFEAEILRTSRVANAIDIARGEMLGLLCEMFEPPGHLLTRDHVFVQIDNELMFSQGAGADLWDSRWVQENGEIKPFGFAEATLLCEQILSLPDKTFREALKLPLGYKPKMCWSLKTEIDAIRPRARNFLEFARGH